MTVLRRLAVPILLFIALIALIAFTGMQRPLDYALYRALVGNRTATLTLADEIRLIDLPYPASLRERDDPAVFRARIADLLNRIADDTANLPKAVVLDVWFSKDDRGLAPLSDAIAKLEQARVRTYASFNPDAGGKTDFDLVMREHARELYADRLAGYGHTRMELHHGILSYPRTIALPSPAGTRELRALPSTVARDLQWPDAFTGASLVVPVGDERSVDERSVAFLHDGDAIAGGRFVATARAPNAAAATPDLRGAVVIVGSLAEDVHAGAPQAGPKLVAWALDDARRGHRNARAPLDSPAIMAGLIVALALITGFAIAGLSRIVPVLQTQPIVLALAGSAVALFALVGMSAASFALGYVVPIGLPLAAIALAAVLGWHYAAKFVASGAAEGSGTYDVFISYSRAHGDWVASRLYEPLAAARGPDGKPLRIFFDRRSIGIGETFTSKYMRAIVDSLVFIPVFSADYYRKNHCRNEMDLAYKRNVDQRLRIAPIAIEPGAVPEIYAVLNYIDVSARPDFIDELLQAILAARKGSAA
ncbi:MAG TPA: toll/interleukin-1 receptor domain-containing protein [Burkholderiaceae bacterium]|nr:toll/interleukin-1 receptor domain-containing protein [Burkholderiaceae bacterium]